MLICPSSGLLQLLIPINKKADKTKYEGLLMCSDFINQKHKMAVMVSALRWNV